MSGTALLIRQYYAASQATATAGDVTPPTLSLAAGTPLGASVATVRVTSNEAGGTAWFVVSTATNQPNATQVQNGLNHLGAAGAAAGSVAAPVVGVNSRNASGLSAGVTYYVHWQQQDAAGNDSDVESSAGFTMLASDPSNNARAPMSYSIGYQL